MFSTGNFKNVVGTVVEDLNPADTSYKANLPLRMELNKDYSWVAMDETAKRDSDIKYLAPSVVHAAKSMFIIRVQYYVHITLMFGLLQRAIVVKLPFLLKRQEVGADGKRNSTATAAAGTDTKDSGAGNTPVGETLAADKPASEASSAVKAKPDENGISADKEKS